MSDVMDSLGKVVAGLHYCCGSSSGDGFYASDSRRQDSW